MDMRKPAKIEWKKQPILKVKSNSAAAQRCINVECFCGVFFPLFNLFENAIQFYTIIIKWN